MQFTFTATVEIEVERSEGKFASRDELAEQLLEAIQEALDSADPGSLEGEMGGQYEVTMFEATVEEQEQPKPVKRRKGVTKVEYRLQEPEPIVPVIDPPPNLTDADLARMDEAVRNDAEAMARQVQAAPTMPEPKRRSDLPLVPPSTEWRRVVTKTPPEVLALDCPKCQARAGEPCRGRSGDGRPVPRVAHAERYTPVTITEADL